MTEIIRTVRPEEREEFERFLERCYGHWRGYFTCTYPDLAEASKTDTSPYLVIEKDGRIVSHVGTHRMTAIVHECQLPCGGIGGVATLPEERGQGYMSRLMEESIRRMREWGIVFSALWGDQQRYQNYGYETCGLKYTLTVTRRACERAGIQAARVEEVDPADRASAEAVARFQSLVPCRIDRPLHVLAAKLRRPSARLFLSGDGYVLATRGTARDLQVMEVASQSGHEAELILGALDISFGSTATVDMGPDEGERMTRLLRAAARWSCSPQAMLRIIDLAGLLEAVRPLLQRRAAGLAPFAVSVGCQWQDEMQWATVEWDGRTALAVTRGCMSENRVTAPVRQLTAWLFGGPHAGRETLGPLAHLLPIPVHFPALDHV
ncbi:MAG: GNAT family N-acetyltransferase [Armatimonadetes bacterium]|nr:GNAT family N-acetyltransferase [Armatimonadota bacterium]